MSTTQSQMLWDVVFKMHTTNVESHVKMLEFMREHTVAGSSGWQTFSSLIEQGHKMVADVNVASVAMLGENNLFHRDASTANGAGTSVSSANVHVNNAEAVNGDHDHQAQQANAANNVTQAETSANNAPSRKRRLDDRPVTVGRGTSPKRFKICEAPTAAAASRKRPLEEDDESAASVTPAMSPKRLRICSVPATTDATTGTTSANAATETSPTPPTANPINMTAAAPQPQRPIIEYDDISALVDARVRYWNKQLFGQTAEKRKFEEESVDEPVSKRAKETEAKTTGRHAVAV